MERKKETRKKVLQGEFPHQKFRNLAALRFLLYGQILLIIGDKQNRTNGFESKTQDDTKENWIAIHQ